jgi:excisionase family DNA binding protein
MDKKMVSTVEVARICGVSRLTVVRWIDNGLLKGSRKIKSGFRRIKETDLIDFMDKHDIPVGLVEK